MSENKNKKIFYIFHGRFPSEKAASLFAAKSCEAFADQGIETVLLVPKRFGRIKRDVFEYYNLKHRFKIVFLPVFYLFPFRFLEKIAFRTSLLTFSISCFIYLSLKAKKEEVIYSNETIPLWLASLSFKNTIYELHDFPEKNLSFYKKFFECIRWVLVTNKWKGERLGEFFKIDSERIICEPNAVEISDFDLKISQDKARSILNLPSSKKIVVYTGHLYSWKGVDVLIEAGKLLGDSVLLYLVGGTKKDIEKYKEKFQDLKNIKFVGHKEHKEIPYWQKSADVLILPNTAKEDISKYYTSPMKLFEYMASSVPIVASDIPSIREIVSDKNAVIFEPDNAFDLAKKIKLLLIFHIRFVFLYGII